MSNAAPPRFDVVIPTVGRPSLALLLDALTGGSGPLPTRIVVVDDRPLADVAPLPIEHSSLPIEICRTYGAGPAAARNAGWLRCSSEWIAFLDDDVVPTPEWRAALAADLRALGPRDAGSVGNVRVHLPKHRRPTDWERNVAALESSRWITADLTYRRAVLVTVGGFDERFRRAYREDVDLAVQVLESGAAIKRGARWVVHPVAPAAWWVSIQRQRGNFDDALMRRRYGRRWRTRVGATNTRLPSHIVVTLAAAAALVGWLSRRRAWARFSTTLWFAGTLAFWRARVRPGPGDVREQLRMLVTSVAIPPVAVWYRARGELAVTRDWWRRLSPRARVGTNSAPRAVLFDRDGTLVHDVAYNGDPDAVDLVEGARDAVERLRAEGVRIGIVTNQSGIARGLLTSEEVAAVNARVDRELGGIDYWAVCPHDDKDGCRCRKPSPGMVLEAAAHLGVAPSQCVVIGDTEGDVAAGRRAGARAILVPNAATLPDELARAPETAATVRLAVDRVLGLMR